MRRGCSLPCPPRWARLIQFAAVLTTPYGIVPGLLSSVLFLLAPVDIEANLDEESMQASQRRAVGLDLLL